MNICFTNFRAFPVVAMTGTIIALLSIPSHAKGVSNSSRLEPTSALTITEAAALAPERNPALDAFSFDVRAAEARKLLVAQQSTELAQGTVTMAERVKETIAARVKAGQVSPLELSRAEIAVYTSKIDYERSTRELLSEREVENDT